MCWSQPSPGVYRKHETTHARTLNKHLSIALRSTHRAYDATASSTNDATTPVGPPLRRPSSIHRPSPPRSTCAFVLRSFLCVASAHSPVLCAQPAPRLCRLASEALLRPSSALCSLSASLFSLASRICACVLRECCATRTANSASRKQAPAKGLRPLTFGAAQGDRRAQLCETAAAAAVKAATACALAALLCFRRSAPSLHSPRTISQRPTCFVCSSGHSPVWPSPRRHHRSRSLSTAPRPSSRRPCRAGACRAAP